MDYCQKLLEVFNVEDRQNESFEPPSKKYKDNDYIKKLETENMMLKKELATLRALNSDLLKERDKLDYIYDVVERLKQEKPTLDKTILDDIVLCPDHPEIKITKYQQSLLSQEKTGTKMIRGLVDLIFEESDIKGKNHTILKKEFPEKIDAITQYAIGSGKCKATDISKTITSKYQGK